MSRTPKEWLIVASLSVVWLAFFFNPGIGFVPGACIYFCFLLVLAISAVQWRSAGWISGLLFALLAATIPGWVLALFWIYERI